MTEPWTRALSPARSPEGGGSGSGATGGSLDGVSPGKRGLRLFRRGPWEAIATLFIAVGVLMLLQPFAIVLYTYSFVTILIGVLLFTVVSKFPE
jgi:hypothetical protein